MAIGFGPGGKIISQAPPLVEIPLPVIFDMLPWSPPGDNIQLSFLYGARALGTFAVVRQSAINPAIREFLPHVIIYVDGNPGDLKEELLSSARIIEIPDGGDPIALQERFKSINPALVVMIRLRLGPKTPERAFALIAQGAEVLHLVADEYGLEEGSDPLFIKERMKEVHLHLVDKGVRDQATLIGGGGIAMAEHMAKLIICGADALSIDIPLLVAMECRVCRRCKEGIACPVELDGVDPLWGSLRIANLMAAWHSQLLEILGAMGIREARRLRGEMGRAMFFEDLELETFATMGKRG
jgi:hypothetical protein